MQELHGFLSEAIELKLLADESAAYVIPRAEHCIE